MYVYIKSEPQLWTVGHYDPAGKWVAESDHGSEADAADRTAHLNGETVIDPNPELLAACRYALEYTVANGDAHDRLRKAIATATK